MLKSEQRKSWQEAMEVEMTNLKKRQVWDLVASQPNQNVLGNRWVFDLKRDEKGNITRYKARLVAQGFGQIKGINFDETFSPVVNFSIIRLFFSLLVVCLKWTHIQCDVTCAYLYAPLREKVFMQQPEGYVQPGKEEMVCKLNKALYGLHQSGREWFFELSKVLTEIGLKKLSYCNCVFFSGKSVILLVYVDDMVIFGKTMKDIEVVLGKLKENFDLKILGKTKRLLGVEFEERANTLLIHQIPYITEICDRFKDFNFPVSSLPIAKGTVYSKSQCPQSDEEQKEMKKIPYRNVLGCLSFLASRTRPDIAYAVNIFSQFQNNPGPEHWHGLLRLLGYVKKTSNYKLKLNCNASNIIGYTDADFASNRDDRISMGGQFICLDRSPITWRTFKEKSVALSTMEAEFIALVEGVKEITWLNSVLDECCQNRLLNHTSKPLVYVDNQAAIDFLKSPIENHRTKHIEVRYYFVRDLYYKSNFDIKYVRSKFNLADIFTKPLTQNELLNFVENIFEK